MFETLNLLEKGYTGSIITPDKLTERLRSLNGDLVGRIRIRAWKWGRPHWAKDGGEAAVYLVSRIEERTPRGTLFTPGGQLFRRLHPDGFYLNLAGIWLLIGKEYVWNYRLSWRQRAR